MALRCLRVALGMVLISLAGAAGAALTLPESARAAVALRGGAAEFEARLLVHPDDVAPGRAAGGPLRLGVLLDPPPGWHLYWRNPGESGLAPQLDWQVDGARVGEIAWPAPSRFLEGDGAIETFGYGERVLLASRAELVAEVPGTRLARVDAEVLVCERECLPIRFSLARALSPGGDPASDAEERRLFEASARTLPRPAQELSVALEAALTAPQAGELGVTLAVRPCAGPSPRSDCAELRAPADGPVFYPETPGFEVKGTRPHPSDPRAWLVTLRGPASAGDAERLRGVLVLADAEAARLPLQVNLPLRPAAPAPPGLGLAGALCLALLGGLVLNLMPCVLPVLAIKVFGVAELAARDRRELRLHGLVYAGGVLASMELLALAVIALRGAGASVGWGFQFQEPLFVAAISALLVLFALNLFGVFEIGAPRLGELGASASGIRRSFFEGLLAVVLATPCSAPFLGTALGFAFAAPPARVLAIFAAIGVGLASPYALVTWMPAWARFVPRSGPWMLSLRAGLGFALLATGVWLVWIFGRSAGSDGVAVLLAWLLAVAFAAWLYGTLQARRPRWLPLAAALAAALLCVPASVGLRPAPAARGGEPEDAWVPYAAAALAAERAAGRPAFVSFTADWCITCKLNERVVLRDQRILEELAVRDFALFRADWTRRDAAIRAELARFGRAGVPLYLVYPAGEGGEPELLPELLSVERVLEALRAAG